MIVSFTVLSQNRSTNTFICKDFQKKTVRDPSVQNMNTVYPVFDSIHTVFQFRNHTSSYKAFGNQLLGFLHMELGKQSGGIVLVLIDAFNIGKKRQFLRMNRLSDGTRRIVAAYLLLLAS